MQQRLYLCSFLLLKMVSLTIVDGFGKALWNYWVISYLRLLELLGKLYLRVAVMMKVLVMKHRVGLSLRFWEGKSVMKVLLHYIWFEQMSAYQFVRLLCMYGKLLWQILQRL
ncbi:hypothetical protein ACFX16_033875 [Malus domestica]